MTFKRKKNSADKAFELCVELLGEIRKQGKAIEALAEEIKGIKGTLAGMEEFLTEEITDAKVVVEPIKEHINGVASEIKAAQTNLYTCEKVTQDSVIELGLRITELKNGVMAYEQKKEDAVTAAQILDEYLNGRKDEQ